MGTELTLPAGFGPLPAALAGSAATNDELGAGVSASYAVVGYKGKVWSLKFGGNETKLMRDDGDGPRNSVDVVLLKANAAISKIFYATGYVEGSTAAPDCWSADGVKPDGSVQKKVNPTCADCPMNAWGSRTTEAGKSAKACSDSRRVAVVPAQDMYNELFGGPMLLRIPAASLKDLKAYGDLLSSYQYPYYGAVTRVSFDPNEAFPKFVFTALRALTEDEAKVVAELRSDKRVATVLSETVDATPAGNAQPPAVPASPFGQSVGGAPAAQPAPAAQAAPQQPVKAAPVPASPFTATQAPVAAPAAPAPVQQAPVQQAPVQQAPVQQAPVQQVADQHEDDNTPSSFDDMLETLIGN